MIRPGADAPSLTEREFRKFQTLIESTTGIHLSAAKKALLIGRLARRLRARGAASYGEYHELVLRDPQECIQMLDAICTNETRFFREPKQFEFLAARLFPEWKAAAAAGARAKTIRVWSAACSSGEEPYSLAMWLLTHFPAAAGWRVEIVASDLSTQVLARAQEGVWPIGRASEIPPALCKRFMLRGVGSQQGKMKAGPEARSVLRFLRVNLHDPACPVAGPFDLIFCRNVLIYFSVASKKAVIGRLLDRLAPEGVLFLGHSESLNGLTEHAHSVGPTAYRRSSARSSSLPVLR